MQGLADGYFVLPVHDRRLPGRRRRSTKVDDEHPAVVEACEAGRRPHRRSCSSINGTRTVDSFHRELGKLMWDYCGMARTEEGLRKALDRIPELREEFWRDVKVPGDGDELNQSLEKAGRVADFLELAELMCLDALHRNESLRRPLPRGVPDPRRRGAARRRELLPTSPPGSARGDGEPPDAAQGSRSTFEYVHLAPAELQVMER